MLIREYNHEYEKNYQYMVSIYMTGKYIKRNKRWGHRNFSQPSSKPSSQF